MVGINIPPGTAVDAGTLSGLNNPLAFIAAPGQPAPTSPSNPAANSFFSATTNGGLDTLHLTFDFHPRTNAIFSLGEDVGNVMLPLAIADGSQNSVRSVTAATLHMLGTGGTAVMTDIVGNLSGMGPKTYQLADLGITSSLNFAKGFLEFDLGIPLLITPDIAPAYLFSAAGFEFDPVLSLFDGINPMASFLDASFADNTGDLLPAVHADLAIAFDASTIVSSPVATPEPATLALLGSGLVGLALFRRRRGASG